MKEPCPLLDTNLRKATYKTTKTRGISAILKCTQELLAPHIIVPFSGTTQRSYRCWLTIRMEDKPPPQVEKHNLGSNGIVWVLLKHCKDL